MAGLLQTLSDDFSAGLNYLENLRQSAASRVADTAEGLSADWTNAVDKLKQASADFDNYYSQLQGLQSVVSGSDQLSAEYNELMARGSTLRSTIISMLNAIAGVYAKITGSSTAPASSLNGLGIFPAIPAIVSVAAIAAATALITKWVSDAVIMIQKANIYRETNQQVAQQVAAAKAAGASPDQINQMVQQSYSAANDAMNSVGKNNLLATVQTAVKIAGIGFGIYYGGKLVIDILRKSKATGG